MSHSLAVQHPPVVDAVATPPVTARMVPWWRSLALLNGGQEGCLFDALQRGTQQYGDFYQLKCMGRPWFVTKSVPLIRDAVLKSRQDFIKGDTLAELRAMCQERAAVTDSDGQEWATLRRQLQPYFTPQASTEVAAATEKFSRAFRPALLRQGEFDSLEVCNRLALAVIMKFLFGHEIEQLTNLAQPIAFLKRQHYLVNQVMRRARLGAYWRRLPLPSNYRVRHYLRDNELYFQAIHARMGHTAPEFLRYLEEGQYADGKQFSAADCIVQMHGLVGAAFESTGSVLHWALYFLSQSPSSLQWLESELDQQVCDDPLQATDVETMPYLQAVVKETMRLRPAFPLLIRQTAQNTKLGDQSIPAGAWFFGLVGAAHQDPKIWGSDAKEFRPERFLEELSSEQEAAYQPYGVGPRQCLGQHLADVEIPLILARLLAGHRFQLLAQPPIHPQLKFSWVSARGIKMRYVARPQIPL